MLSDSAAKLFDVLIVWKIDRFGRNRNEIAVNKLRLKKNGVRVMYAKESIPDGPEGIILESVLEGMAEYYIYDLVEKTMRGKKGQALKCRHTGGRPLLGYKVNPDKSYSVDEAGASTVRLIFSMYAEGYTYSQIIDRLNAEGRKTGRGASFGKNSLYDLLKNERYIGVYTFGRIRTDEFGVRNSHKKFDDDDVIRVEGGIPAIIDHETWDRVQQKMEANKRAPARAKAKIDYLLTGKIYCGKCGSAMVGRTSTTKGTQYPYYECNAKKRLRNCDKKNVKKDEIEQLVINCTYNYVLRDDNIQIIAEKVAEVVQKENDNTLLLTDLRAKLKQTEVECENVMKAIRAGIITAGVKADLERLEEEKSVLQSRIAIEEAQIKNPITKDFMVYWLKEFRNCDITSLEGQKKLIDTFVNAVYVYDDRVIITYNWNGDKNKLDVGDLAGFPSSAPNDIACKARGYGVCGLFVLWWISC